MKKQPKKLPKAFKSKWVKALRSGKYKQGDLYLKEVTSGKTTYCCLGVACEVMGIRPKRLKLGRDVENHLKRWGSPPD